MFKKKTDGKADVEPTAESDPEKHNEDSSKHQNLEADPQVKPTHSPNPWDPGPGRARTDL
jgi:hypothetical protein